MADITENTGITLPPCSQMWNQIMINSMGQFLRTCWDRIGTEISIEEIEKFGPDVFTLHPDILKDRKHFLTKDSLPDKCLVCKFNWPSRAENLHNRWKEKSFTHWELKDLETADLIQRFEIYYGKTCNLACVYCNKEHSTRWEALLNHVTPDNPEWREAILKALYQYLERRIRSGNREPLDFRFGGGEPFLNPGYFETLESILEIYSENNIHIEGNTISVLSNLSYPHSLMERYIELANNHPSWKWIVSGSIDALGSVGENLRTGLEIEKFKKNLELLAKQKNIIIEIMPSISSISFPETPELLEWLLKFADEHGISNNRLDLSENLITNPYALNVSTLPEKYKEVVDHCLEIVRGTRFEHKSLYFEKIRSRIGTRRQPEHLDEIRLEMTQFGYAQRKNYFELFPILSDILDPSL